MAAKGELDQVSKRTKLAAANWSELQIDLLELILKRLAFVDIVRFKSVCSSWNMAAGSYISSPSYTPFPQIPWLMLRTVSDTVKDKIDPNSRIFISVPDKKVYKVKDKFEGLSKRWCVGSSYGWLAIMDRTNLSAQLFNPFSGVMLPLPNINTGGFQNNAINKLVLSSDPSRSKTFSVAVMYGGRDRLAFWKYGDDSWTWTRLESENVCYRDIICHNGKIYALSYRFTVDIWEFHSLFPTKVSHIGPDLDTIEDQFLHDRKLVIDQVSWCFYLMESLGELFIVEHVVNATDTSSTLGFIVCKLDWGEEKVCIRPLRTLCNRAILLGVSLQATSVSTQDFPELEENSIYFVGRYDHMIMHDVLLYNIKEEKIHRCGYEDGIIYGNSITWMVPNPR